MNTSEQRVIAAARAWREKAKRSREEAERIRRTIKAPTVAEERCYVRADIWEECADEIKQALDREEQQDVCECGHRWGVHSIWDGHCDEKSCPCPKFRPKKG